MPDKFVIHPPKFENESIEGYVYRLSIINHTSLKYTGIQSIKAKATEREITAYFDIIFKLTGQIYNKDHFIHEWNNVNLTLPKWRISKSTRFCPLCLMDSLYHRFYWSISISTYCYKHQCYLNDDCDSCGKKLILRKPSLVDVNNVRLNYLLIRLNFLSFKMT